MSPFDIVVDRWDARFLGRRFACSIGKGGFSDQKREGDGATPVGTHRIVGCLYRADRMVKPMDWAHPIGPSDLWSDASGDAAYNSQVSVPYPHSHERLARADPLYDLVLITDWNWPVAQAGKGSAIFVHQWRRPRYPTEGCVAFARSDLHWIARQVRLGTKLIVRA